MCQCHRIGDQFGVAVTKLSPTCERHIRDHKYSVAPDKCEVVPPVYGRDSHVAVELYGDYYPLYWISGGGSSTAMCKRMLTSIVQLGVEYGMALVNLSKGQQVAMDKAWYRIFRKTLSMPATAGGSAIPKVLGVLSVSCRARKLSVRYVARVYGAQPGTLTGIILGYATKGWDSTKRKTLIKTSEKNIHWTRIKDDAAPSVYCGA